MKYADLLPMKPPIENGTLSAIIAGNTTEVKHLTEGLSDVKTKLATLDERLDEIDKRLVVIETRTKTLSRAGGCVLAVVTALGTWLGISLPSDNEGASDRSRYPVPGERPAERIELSFPDGSRR